MADMTDIDLELDVASALSLGARSRQEDALATAFPQGSDIGFAVLSDGMGGHARGDLASRIIVTEIFAELTLATARPEFELADIPRLLCNAVGAANDCLRGSIDADPATEGMGGTVIATVLVDGALHWISVGDSPLYLFRDGELSQLNEDHSMAPQIDLMVHEGIINAQEGLDHPQRNCLTSALTGDQIATIDCPAEPFALMDNDLVIVASDGLQYLSNAEIADILTRTGHQDGKQIASGLISAVEGLGDPEQDNTSLVVIKSQSKNTAIRQASAGTSPVTMFKAAARAMSPMRQMMTRGG